MPMAPVSLKDYWNMLNWHDWYYEFSDDGRVWREGKAAQEKLRAIAGQSPAHKDLFNGFASHHNDIMAHREPPTPIPPQPS